jgi:organic radical activating enzyme
LQPCDSQDPLCNQAILNKTIKYILQHPKWKLSLQTHKILHVR